MRIGIVGGRIAANTLLRTVARAPEHQVAWIAATDAEALGCCASQPPEVVLITLGTDGIDAVDITRRIMAATPCAILLVCRSVRLSAAEVFEAMGHGALDAIDMPLLDARDPARAAASLLARIGNVGRLLAGHHGKPMTIGERRAAPGHRLVALGASAGGPAALAAILRGLPRDFPAGVVVVQHVDEQFAPGMADWLGQHCLMPVRIARDGDRPEPGTVLLAGTSDHLALATADHLGYTPDPREYLYRPSVDVFFSSVARLWRGDAIGVLLTGMGRDGALGLKAMRDNGCHTIAQNEATSAVYGMPKAAVMLDAAVEVLPIRRIAARLRELLA